MSRARQPEGPLDVALRRLREHRLLYRWDEKDLRSWWATCPCCRADAWTLRLREPYRGAPISLYCESGCSHVEVRAALEQTPVHPRIEALECSEAQAWRIAEDAREIAAEAIKLATGITAPAPRLQIAVAA